ncbi:MAG: hypothetical protein ACHQJ6_07130 [Candidatus Berkiellales bacterium]
MLHLFIKNPIKKSKTKYLYFTSTTNHIDDNTIFTFDSSNCFTTSNLFKSFSAYARQLFGQYFSETIITLTFEEICQLGPYVLSLSKPNPSEVDQALSKLQLKLGSNKGKLYDARHMVLTDITPLTLDTLNKTLASKNKTLASKNKTLASKNKTLASKNKNPTFKNKKLVAKAIKSPSLGSSTRIEIRAVSELSLIPFKREGSRGNMSLNFLCDPPVVPAPILDTPPTLIFGKINPDNEKGAEQELEIEKRIVSCI